MPRGGLLTLDGALGKSTPALLRVGQSTAQSLLTPFVGTALQMSAEPVARATATP